MDLSPRRRRPGPAQANRKPTNTHFRKFLGFPWAKLQGLALSFFKRLQTSTMSASYVIANDVFYSTLTPIPHEYEASGRILVTASGTTIYDSPAVGRIKVWQRVGWYPVPKLIPSAKTNQPLQTLWGSEACWMIPNMDLYIRPSKPDDRSETGRKKPGFTLK